MIPWVKEWKEEGERKESIRCASVDDDDEMQKGRHNITVNVCVLFPPSSLLLSSDVAAALPAAASGRRRTAAAGAEAIACKHH